MTSLIKIQMLYNLHVKFCGSIDQPFLCLYTKSYIKCVSILYVLYETEIKYFNPNDIQ